MEVHSEAQRRSSIVEAVGILATCTAWAWWAVLIFAGRDRGERGGIEERGANGIK